MKFHFAKHSSWLFEPATTLFGHLSNPTVKYRQSNRTRTAPPCRQRPTPIGVSEAFVTRNMGHGLNLFRYRELEPCMTVQACVAENLLRFECLLIVRLLKKSDGLLPRRALRDPRVAKVIEMIINCRHRRASKCQMVSVARKGRQELVTFKKRLLWQRIVAERLTIKRIETLYVLYFILWVEGFIPLLTRLIGSLVIM